VKGNIQVVRIFNPPPKGHWVWKKNYTLVDAPGYPGFFQGLPKKDPSHLSIHSTFRKNIANLNESFIQKLLSYQSTDPDYYGIMVEGLISEGAKGRIYRNWQTIEVMPNNYEKFYGLDFGFENDPVALVECEMHNNTVWVEEKVYETGMLNTELSKRMLTLGVKKGAKIYADSAEPKDIEDLKRMGWNVIKSDKGPGKSGIQFVKQYNIVATESSKNLWKENENYKWALDQHKNPTNDPADEYNHLMDAIRYAIVTKMRKPNGIRVL